MTSAALRAWSPWRDAGGRRAAVLAAAGHGLWLLGWWMAAREAAFSRQLSGVNVAVVGFVVVAWADVSWLARSHRRIVDRRRALLARLGPEPGRDSAAQSVVVGPGRDHYHRPGCRFAAGRNWPVLRRHEVDGPTPCGVCRP